MKYASIDIGTNTVLMLIASVEHNKTINEIMDVSIITRLGEGLKETGFLQEHAMERTISVLQQYMNIAKKQGGAEILCVGTSALREAKNSGLFLKKVKDDLDLKVRVITEKEEAYYTYLSILYDPKINPDDCIIVDIGGGSTEIIKADKSNFIDFVSIPIGSVKLTEMFIAHDPVLKSEIHRMKRFIIENLNLPFTGKNCTFVGTGGTITNVAGIKMGLKEYIKALIHGFKITIDEIDRIIEAMIPLKVSEKERIPGLEAGREDIILQGIILLREIMGYLSFNEMIVSANG
ncbi:MAG: Ppx/GppA family phosphatase, partial [Syntrophorhabdaceae bacterium]|nr:Ppx/GppA family phosphatase [Syntrophorhabdaceae bacterium]